MRKVIRFFWFAYRYYGVRPVYASSQCTLVTVDETSCHQTAKVYGILVGGLCFLHLPPPFMQANKQRTNQNSPSKGYLTKGITRILQLNVEGFSKSKAEVLERIATEEKIDVLVVQETHTADQEQLSKRGHITGFTIAGATFHSKYGTATYIKSDLKWNHIRTSEENSIYTIETQVGNLHVTNIYKPPNTIWPTPVLHSPNHPTIYIGDFNSHNTMWGYNDNDTQGEELADWSEAEGLELVFDAKQRGTFRSARWNREYNPDLCFISTDQNGTTLPISRRVLTDFPNSQHRPVVIEVGFQIPTIRSIPRARFP